MATGARAACLRGLLCSAGLGEGTTPPSPRLHTLPIEIARAVLAVYGALGGVLDDPVFAPGRWDLAFDGGLVVELDEQMHFNRYRGITLDAPWAARLPWTEPYKDYAHKFERRAGSGGRRWTSKPAERMFGPADPDGVFGRHGAPRWKQRALYDAMKDAAAAAGMIRLARVSIYDRVDGSTIDDILYGRGAASPDAVLSLVCARTFDIAG